MRNSKGLLQQTLRALLLLCALCSTPSLWAQSSPWISASFKNLPISEALSTLEENYALKFSYDAQLLQKYQVNSTFENLPLEKALLLLLKNTDLTFELLDGGYILLEPMETEEKTVRRFFCGQVVDALTEEGLEFATVFLPRLKTGGSTNADGFFQMAGAFEATDRVEISYVGFQKVVRQVRDLQTEACPLVRLKQEAAILQDVIIREENQRGISYTQQEPMQVLRTGKLQHLAGQIVPDALGLVQLLPGVLRSEGGAAGLHVRGGTTDQNLVLFDGIPVYHGGHFFGMVSAFNSEVVEKVEVHKRGFSPRYGGRLASVIDVKSEALIPERASGSVGMNFLYGQAAIHVPLVKNKLSVLAAGRLSTSSFFSNPTNNRLFDQGVQEGRIEFDRNDFDTGDTLRPSYDFDDFNAKINWQPNDKNTLTASFLYTRDFLAYNVEQPFTKPTSDTMTILNWGYSAQWKHTWSEQWSSAWQGRFSHYDYTYVFLDDVSREAIDYFLYEENELDEWNFSWENHWRKTDRHTLHFGYEFFRYGVTQNDFIYSNITESVNSFETAEADLQVLFANYHFSLPDLLQLSMGLRYNYYHPTAQHLMEPRFRANLQLSPAWQIELNAGEYHQFIGQFVDRNELSGDGGNWILAQSASNTGVQPPVMKGQHFSMGAFFKQNGFELSLEAYQKRTTGLSSFSVRFGEYLSAWNLGEAQSRGFEVLVQKQLPDLQLLGSYTISQTDFSFLYWDEGRPFPASFDQRHLLHVLANWTPGNWEAGIKWTLGSGKPFTQAEGLVFPEGVVDSVGRVIQYGPQNADRLPAFHRLDASINYHIKPKLAKGWRMSLGFSALNIYGRQNILDRYSIHSYDWNGEKVVLSIRELNRQGLPFTPNLSMRVYWE